MTTASMDIAAALIDLEISELQECEARDDLLGFAQMFTQDYHAGWIHREIADALMGVVRGIENQTGPRVMLFVPPGHGKSQLVSRCLPAWCLGRHPDWEVVCATYGQDLSSDLGAKVRGIIKEPRYAHVFPMQLDDSSQARERFDTTVGGSYRAVGVGGALAGRRASLLIIDDPVKGRAEADSETYRAAAWDWYSSVARTRLYPGAGIVLLMTRYHQLDLAGMILDQAKSGGEQWTVIRYPAIAEDDEPRRKKGEALHPERYPLSELEPLRRTLPPRDWLALYQQRPVGDEGGYFQRAWLRSYDSAPAVGDRCIAADLAIKTGEDNDYSAIGVFGETSASELAWLDIEHGKRHPMESIELILDKAKAHRADILYIGRDQIIGSLGPYLTKRMEERRIWLTIIEVPEVRDLERRARSYQARMQAKKVLFPSGLLFNEVIVPEHLAFPGGKHDDLIAMGSNACYGLDQTTKPAKPRAIEYKNPDKKRWDELSQRDKRGQSDIIKPLFGG